MSLKSLGLKKRISPHDFGLLMQRTINGEKCVYCGRKTKDLKNHLKLVHNQDKYYE